MNKLKRADRITVFHGSYSDKPPHEYDNFTFHAGTSNSALDRLASSEQDAVDAGLDIENPKMHKYEIRVQPSMLTYEDPHEPYRKPKGFTRDLGVNADDEPSNIIKKYVNRFEDEGSLSYVIPSHFVEKGYVKYLGDQFAGMRSNKE